MFLSKLREALGSLRCLPFSTANDPHLAMTAWARTSAAPETFELGGDVEMLSPKEGRTVRCKRQDLTASEVLNHIESGMYVNKLQLVWRESATFTLGADLALSGLKFEDCITDQATGQSKAEQFDQEFAVMTVELRNLLNCLFAGVDKTVS